MEKISFRPKPSIAAVHAALLVLAYLAGCAYGFFHGGLLGLAGTAVMFGLPCLPLVDHLYQLVNTEYTLAGGMIIAKKRGILKSTEQEMPFSKVENVEISTSAVSDLFGYGNVIVSGTGGARLVLWGVENPTAIREAITASSPAAPETSSATASHD